MPVYRLTDELVFPDVHMAEPEGLLAVGGDLRPERVLLAYASGIFPWYSEEQPLLWWCPSPRLVLLPEELHVSRSLRKAVRRSQYRITVDCAFERVMRACGKTIRPGQDGTWITEDLVASFVELHRRGFAHSVEAWEGETLVGGLYGLAVGSVFCGESMFAHQPDASKVAFVTLVEQLRRWRFTMVDCQVPTDHLRRFGAREIELDDFLERLADGIDDPWKVGAWKLDAPE